MYFIALYESNQFVCTDEGQPFIDEPSAVSSAHQVIRDVVCADISTGKTVDLDNYVTIESDDGAVIRKIFFRDVVLFTKG